MSENTAIFGWHVYPGWSLLRCVKTNHIAQGTSLFICQFAEVYILFCPLDCLTIMATLTWTIYLDLVLLRGIRKKI